MKKISTALAGLPLVISGCGGGGGSGSDPATPPVTADISQYKGTWSNDSIQTFTTASGNTISHGRSEGLVSSNNKLAYVTGDYKAIFVDPATQLGHYFSAYTYVDSVSITMNRSGNNLSIGFNNTDREIYGTISLAINNDYSSMVTLADLAGTWVDDNSDSYYYSNNGTWTVTVQSDGSIDAVSTTGCNASGNLSAIDTNANEFNVEMTVTLCGNAPNNPFNGNHTGIAYKTVNENTQDTLVLMTTNGFNSSSRALVIKPSR